MASVYPLPDSNGIMKFKAEIREVGYQRKSKKFQTKEEANAWADEQMADIYKDRFSRGIAKSTLPESGEYGDEPLVNTIESFWKQKATDQQKANLPTLMLLIAAPKNKDQKSSESKKNEVKVGELTERWIEDHIAKMRATQTVRGEPYSYSTILKHMTIIKAAIKWRARRLELKSVPAFNFTAKEMFPEDWEVERERRLEKVEERKLRQLFRLLKGNASIHWRLLMRFALETCARQGEMVKATWSEISCINNLWFWTIPKKHNKSKRTRVVPLTINAVRVIKFLRRMESPTDPRLFHFFKKPGVVSKLFHDHVDECEIEDLRWHDLRHESITRFVLRERNFTVDEIMKIVGHRSREMLDRYTNVRGDELAAKLMRRAPSVPQERAKLILRLLALAELDDKDVVSSPSVNDDHFHGRQDHAA